MLGYPVALGRESAVEPYVLVIACLVGGLVVWLLLRVGAKRPTAGWAWVLILLFVIALAADVLSVWVLGTNAKDTFSSVPQQENEEK